MFRPSHNLYCVLCVCVSYIMQNQFLALNHVLIMFLHQNLTQSCVLFQLGMFEQLNMLSYCALQEVKMDSPWDSPISYVIKWGSYEVLLPAPTMSTNAPREVSTFEFKWERHKTAVIE